MWIDVLGDAPGVMAGQMNAGSASSSRHWRSHSRAVSQVPTSARGPRNNQYARLGTTTFGRCVIEGEAAGSGANPGWAPGRASDAASFSSSMYTASSASMATWGSSTLKPSQTQK
jgi:hypothetical protein